MGRCVKRSLPAKLTIDKGTLMLRSNRIKRYLLIAWAVLVCAALPAWSQDAKLNLKNLEKLSSKAANVTDVSLDGAMLQLAAQAMDADKDADKDEKQAKEFISRLKGVYVKVFEFDKDNQYSSQDVEGIRAQLKGPAWERAVNVREEKTHEMTEVYLMKEGGAVIGLTVLVAEPRELTVVNVVGPIDLTKLGALGALKNFGANMPQLKTREKEKPVSAPATQKK